MARVDQIFRSIAAALVPQWGIPATYISVGTSTYDPDTGAVTADETTTDLTAVLLDVVTSDLEALSRGEVWRLLLDADQLTSDPVVGDRMELQFDTTTRFARVSEVKTYRGEGPILHTLTVRAQ